MARRGNVGVVYEVSERSRKNALAKSDDPDDQQAVAPTICGIVEVIPTENTGRGGGIRTPDPLLPKQMRYQTALRPDVIHLIVSRKVMLPKVS